MDARDAARQDTYAPQAVAATAPPVGVLSMPSRAVGELAWAGVASTLHRVRRGEGALLAVNLSLIAQQGIASPHGIASALVSVLCIGLMYAFNDLYDAPSDANNPKKDRAVIATYLEHRRVCLAAILVLKVLTLELALTTLGTRATVAAAGVMLVNVVYSTLLKGVPVLDVIWCGLWGVLYTAIVTASASLLVLVGLMTAVCHLYQTLDDRVFDAENAIVTTAVRSAGLSRNVLFTLSALLFVALRPVLGAPWALTAFTPLAIFLAFGDPRTGWLLTKVYFGGMWLYLLEIARAAG